MYLQLVLDIYKRWRMSKGQTKKENPEKLAILGCTRRRKTNQKHNPVCVVYHYIYNKSKLDDNMVIVIGLCAIECGFDHRSGRTKDNTIGIFSFSDKQAILSSESSYSLMVHA